MLIVRTLAIALAIGLDVLALSIGIGTLGIPLKARLRVGGSFAFAELLMQVIGAAIGTGAGHLAGEIAAYTGFVLLAGIGTWIVRESFGERDEITREATSGWGLFAASASISLDSLGVGFSLPSLGVPLLSLMMTVAVTTVVLTLAGLQFGEVLGRRSQKLAQRGAGTVLVVLAIAFTIEHLVRAKAL